MRKFRKKRAAAAAMALAVLVSGCGAFPLQAAESVNPVDAAQAGDFAGNVYDLSVDINQIEELTAQYGPVFNGGNIHLKLDGYAYDCLKFLTGFYFADLDLECTFSDFYSYDNYGNFYRLADVVGLTKLTITDGGYGFFSTDDVYEFLTDLTLDVTGENNLVYGDMSSRQMPSLKHLTLLFEDASALFWAGREDMIFPASLETIEICFGGEPAAPEDITEARLIGALTQCCPDVLVNNVPVSQLIPEGEADMTPEAFLEKGRTGAVLKQILDGVRYGTIVLSGEMPQIYGKLLFAYFTIGYDERRVLYRSSVSMPEPEWEYMALMPPEEHPENPGDVYGYYYVPADILASGISDADTLVIIYEDPIPIESTADQGSGDEGGLFLRQYKVIIADVKNEIVYAPYIALSADPREGFDTYEPGIDEATSQIMQVYNSGGSMTEMQNDTTAMSVQNTGLADVGDEKLAEILKALNNQNCIDTMTALQNGDTVVNGSYSYTAAGVQQTLVDFGCDISVDGSAGPATFAALNQILTSFGMEPAQEVNADLYAELMPLLLISTDEGAARTILYEEYSDKDGSRFDYLRGCALYAKGNYYSAMEAFLESEYGDSLLRAEQCEQPWPSNGELWHNGSMYSSDMYLTFEVNSYNESEGMCFEIYAEDGTLASILFLTGTGSVSTSLPGGKYRIRDAVGTSWYGWKDAFGRDGRYEFLVFNEYEEDEYLTWLGGGYAWTIAIHYDSGMTGTGVGSESSSWDEWSNH